MMKLKSSKGALSLGDMGGLAIAFITVAIIIGIGGTIMTSVQATQTVSTVAYNASTKALTGIGYFGDWLPTIATIVAAAVVLGVIYYFRN